MQRLARVASWWNWLPSFRAVAETENVHEAARAIGVSPSSLSRTIRLLEDQLERPLFERAAAGLRLTPFGRELLEVTRAAMRQLDDALGPGRDVLAIAACAPLASAVVIPVLARLAGELTARVTRDPDRDAVGRLLRGELDLVLGSSELTDRHLVAEQIGTLQARLFVAVDHPLAAGSVTLADVLGWPFVGYRGAEAWPGELRPRFALQVEDLRDAASAAATSRLVVVLPARIGRQDPALRAVGPEPWPAVPVIATRRRNAGTARAADVVTEAAREALR